MWRSTMRYSRLCSLPSRLSWMSRHSRRSRAANFIATLDPKPGQIFTSDPNNYVLPDVTVERISGDWMISLNGEQIPHLRISNTYKDLMSQEKNGADVRDYIEDMALAYQSCDFAVCRAGAMTVAELACAGVPAVLVPYPSAVDDHQTGNAEFLSTGGAAWLIQQKDLSAEKLAQLIAKLDRPTLAAMSAKALGLAKPDATQRVADICEGLVR